MKGTKVVVLESAKETSEELCSALRGAGFDVCAQSDDGTEGLDLIARHQPQAAVWGQTHFRVSKAVEDGRTVTRIERLSPAARVGEVARMLGGGDAALRHAEAMLAAQPTQTELGL